VAAGALHLAEVVVERDEVARTGGHLLAGQAGQGLFGLHQPAAQPVGHRQVVPGKVAQRVVGVGQVGQGLLGELGGPLGVAAQAGEHGRRERDRGRQVGQQAHRPADRRLVRLLRLVAAVGERPLGVGQ
jgi:hypothetical protein